MRRFKSFLLILMALWLPLQAAAAVAMPFCRHAAEQPLQAAALQSPEHCHEHAGNAAGPEGGAGSSDLACDNCEMCHLASAGYLPVTANNLTLATVSAHLTLTALTPLSHIGDPPLQPPRRQN
ncbi:MAG: hypothetical protein ACYCWC_11820 [Rhodocyclaceae bacterium]